MFSKTSTSSSDNNSDKETTWERYSGLEYGFGWGDLSKAEEPSQEPVPTPTQETAQELSDGRDAEPSKESVPTPTQETTQEYYDGRDYDAVWDLSREDESSKESVPTPTQETSWTFYLGPEFDAVWALSREDEPSQESVPTSTQEKAQELSDGRDEEPSQKSVPTPTQETTWEPYGGLDYDTVWDLRKLEEDSQEADPTLEKLGLSTIPPASSTNTSYFASVVNYFHSFLDKTPTSTDVPAEKEETVKKEVQAAKSEDDKQTAPQDKKSQGEQWFESPAYNLMFKVPIISAGITSVIQPTNLIMANIINHSNPIKGMPVTPSAFLYTLYKGFGNNVVAGQMRGAVSVSAKQSQSLEVAKEAELTSESTSGNKNSQLINTVGFAQADTLVSQYGNRGMLTGYYAKEGIFQKMLCPIEKIPLTLNNAKQIVVMGYPIKTTGGIVTYGAMVIGSDFIEKQELFSNPTTNKVIASMMSGALASVITTPISIVNDKIVLSTAINSQNQLTRLNFSQSMQVAKHFVRDPSFKTKLAYAGPMNAVRTTIIFGTLTLANELLGDQPLKKVKDASVVVLGMFSKKEKDKLSPTVEKDQTEELVQTEEQDKTEEQQQTGEKENTNSPK
jgi:hypothetical protein